MVDISGHIWGFLNFWSAKEITGCFRKSWSFMGYVYNKNAFINQQLRSL